MSLKLVSVPLIKFQKMNSQNSQLAQFAKYFMLRVAPNYSDIICENSVIAIREVKIAFWPLYIFKILLKFCPIVAKEDEEKTFLAEVFSNFWGKLQSFPFPLIFAIDLCKNFLSQNIFQIFGGKT